MSTTWGMTSEPADSWHEKALCRPELHDDPELFFPIGNKGKVPYRQTEKAKQFCQPCPVKAECLNWALTHGCDGIWGGTSALERERMRRGATRYSPGDRCPQGHARNADNVRYDRRGAQYCAPCRRNNGHGSARNLRTRQAVSHANA